MIKLPVYEVYHGETSIAVLDNSAIDFLEKIEKVASDYTEILFKEYDVIFIPEWVLNEVADSEFRSRFVEALAEKLPVYKIKETSYCLSLFLYG